jgi:hypothetical protein
MTPDSTEAGLATSTRVAIRAPPIPGPRPHGTRGLYTALDRLRADGLIEVEREEIVENRLRCYYRLTSVGSERLAGEAARLQSNASVAMTRLNLSSEAVTR